LIFFHGFPIAFFFLIILPGSSAIGRTAMQETQRVSYEDAHKPARTAGLSHNSLGFRAREHETPDGFRRQDS
jgi:hypothetical protein